VISGMRHWGGIEYNSSCSAAGSTPSRQPRTKVLADCHYARARFLPDWSPWAAGAELFWLLAQHAEAAILDR
jgi:hypothetical protein